MAWIDHNKHQLDKDFATGTMMCLHCGADQEEINRGMSCNREMVKAVREGRETLDKPNKPPKITALTYDDALLVMLAFGGLTKWQWRRRGDDETIRLLEMAEDTLTKRLDDLLAGVKS